MGEHKIELATLGGGCFWCLEAVFEEVGGIESVVSGYCGGHTERPDYRSVCGGETGHAEVVRLAFDPGVISFADLLRIFFVIHDPTTRNRQGNDIGTQYRSVIFCHSPEQRATAQAVIAETQAADLWPDPIVTELRDEARFHPAEDYHQHYFARNPEQAYCRIVVAPKVAKLRKHFLDKLRRGA